MAFIKIITPINAPVDSCFDLSRSIDLHLESMQNTNEKAIAGIVSGLINLNETVTWKAKHFGVALQMTSKITELKFPEYFVDQMVDGPFKLLRHLHSFRTEGEHTLMIDEFVFKSPFGLIGKLVDKFILTTYLKQLLKRRNAVIKQIAEAKALGEPAK